MFAEISLIRHKAVNMSSELADTLSHWANWALLTAAAVGAAATAVGAVASFVIWRTGLVKDAEFARYRVEAEAKVADATNAGLNAGRKAVDAAVAAAKANERAAEANERAEQLKAANLLLQRDLLTVQKSVKGREISDEQQRVIVNGARHLKLPDLTVYYNKNDLEARVYAWSIASVLEDIGMTGRMVSLSENPPQNGAAFVGTGTLDEARFLRVLFEADIVTIGANGDANSPPGFGVERTFGVPMGSIVVGVRLPWSTFRDSKEKQKRPIP